MREFKSHTPKSPAAPLRSGARPGGESVDAAARARAEQAANPKPESKEIGGPEGPEPTRYGDWERKGICVDF
ncbi:DUF1674 domain-containing protein [Aquibaculum arenosum]|uniref:DUF1674 domain-containing protein n=1 Tax=Aquibaculum arenosum TaxID=3032591 RepID=A0ABT5YKL8_9PROT|nr:succinate dehydrogenase assembly factor 4 [Fodinicurvata sp. CAU 1616]MDF2095453.1 DUF1674 domain-containing protein [Fodinicurvata sp. CAU 1616]